MRAFIKTCRSPKQPFGIGFWSIGEVKPNGLWLLFNPEADANVNLSEAADAYNQPGSGA
jgi:hypothetical protein